MKAELPRFMTLSTQFIDPLFHSFFYMQCVLPLLPAATPPHSRPAIPD